MRSKLIVCIVATVVCCSAAYGRTLTLDEFPSGTVLSDSSYYRLSFLRNFQAIDHTLSSWGPPHSGSNVLTVVADPYYDIASVLFGRLLPTALDVDHIRSVGAYFSTDTGAMVRITAYHISGTYTAVTSLVIGAAGESWNNRYVEISCPQSSFWQLRFEGVNSSSELLSFCADDMTITYVPEPSSLLALCAGLVSAGALLRRRRRR